MSANLPDPYSVIGSQLADYHALIATLPPARYQSWLNKIFPSYVYRPMADFHHEYWALVDQIQPGIRPRPIIAPFFRASGKSTGAELTAVYLGARKKRKYALYICETQAKANDHLASIRGLIESSSLAQYYPEFSNPRIGNTGSLRGWNMQRLWTSGDFIVDAIGMDAAARGAKIDQQRPDLEIFDDVDDENDSPAAVLKKETQITTKFLPAGTLEDLAVIFVQNLVHRDSVMARLVDGRAKYLRTRVIVGGGAVPIMTDCKLSDDQLTIEAGKPRWSAMSVTECQGLLDDWGPRAFQLEGLQNVNIPYVGAIFPAFDPIYHVITRSEFIKVYGRYRTDAGILLKESRNAHAMPAHGNKYWAQDVGTTLGHPCVTLWAWKPGEDMPLNDCLFFYREMCRPVFPSRGDLELVAPVRIGMEVQDKERATNERITWRIGSHEQATTRNSYLIDLPMVTIPGMPNMAYSAMYVEPIATQDGDKGKSTIQDLLYLDNIPHPFRTDPRVNEPLPRCPQLFLVVPDDQGALYVDPATGQLKVLEATNEDGFNRTRWEFPRYRYRTNQTGEESEQERKIDDDAMDAMIAMCAKAQFSIKRISDRERAMKILVDELRGDLSKRVVPDGVPDMSMVSRNYHIQAQEKQIKRSSKHWMDKLLGD